MSGSSEQIKPIVSVRELTPLCGGCPSDWDARDHLGREIYIRYRWGNLLVQITQREGEIPETIASIKHGDPYDGIMSSDEMIALTRDAIEWVSYQIHFQ